MLGCGICEPRMADRSWEERERAARQLSSGDDAKNIRAIMTNNVTIGLCATRALLTSLVRESDPGAGGALTAEGAALTAEIAAIEAKFSDDIKYVVDIVVPAGASPRTVKKYLGLALCDSGHDTTAQLDKLLKVAPEAQHAKIKQVVSSLVGLPMMTFHQIKQAKPDLIERLQAFARKRDPAIKLDKVLVDVANTTLYLVPWAKRIGIVVSDAGPDHGGKGNSVRTGEH